MDRRHEGFFEGHDGLTLFFQIWESAQARGTVLITHGQGEHSECYHRVVEHFKNDGWNFWGWDMRGHGRSEGKRGYAAEFEDYVRDYRVFLRQALNDPRVKQGPVVLLSHSMGALVQLKALIENPGLPVVAQVCSAPFLGLALPVPKWKVNAAHLMNNVYPQITMWNEIRNGDLTRDPDVIREFEQDVLRHDRISPGVFLGFEPAWDLVRSGASAIQTPTLFQLPEKDPVVDTRFGLSVFENLGSKEKVLKVYGDGARHEMYNDTHREAVLHDLKTFLNSFLEA
ncbi:MAG: lysophospholipase [Bdellovibrionaceae bacterium]|nr:lysophospholipase [Pseudobdellovibrionaceae bacterium]MBX3032512.1 lysophospholipase [Pseudobdellovibrionaceae bacterium]